jgi:hypothetical protein
VSYPPPPQSNDPSPEAYPGAPPPMGYPAAPAPKKSKAGKIVLIILAVVLVVCGGGATAAYFALRDTAGDVIQATQTRLVTPDTLAGRAKLSTSDLQAIVDQMITDMKRSVPGASSTVAAFYGDPAKQDMVMVAGASGYVTDPGKQLDDSFAQMATSGLVISGIEAVDPGPLGGDAKCGTGDASGVPVVLCVWADPGSVGVVGFYFKKNVDEIKAEFVKIRGEVEQRS